jgi:hypothetical protein
MTTWKEIAESIIDKAVRQIDPPCWVVVISVETMHSIRLLAKELSKQTTASPADQPAPPVDQPTPPVDQPAPPTPPPAPEPSVSVGSAEANFAPNSGPISNERGAGTIYGTHGSRLRHPNLPPPPHPISTNKDVTMGQPGPQPIQNDPVRTIAK